MPQANVTMNVRRPNQGVGIIDISGQITAFAENVLMDAYSEASSDSTKAIVLNFSELDYMNSSGIGLLVTLLIRAQRQKQQLLAYGLNDHYRQIFDLTRLDEAIALFGSEAEALAAAG
jgi:anti-sigma B factor antagonist